MRRPIAQRARRLRFATGLALACVLTLAAGSARAEPRQSAVENCAACHGLDGIARDTEVPHLAGQNERYLFNQMMAFRTGKRAHKEMRYMARNMSVEEIAALAAYYAALPPR
ncbi:c-type cytochrome [Bosea sp. (in: a-proteobacteria)]|uniref:c-type cytochrome n=1 Tax=Bosea sp. (in: a-proteobacteria) TaxID=1871050 RepID=UPI00273320F3|nr:c-type cytochrome [Bosea sp. (in: a-proteobacteria)]MDP3409972.1 c-type cytochrome [Bosea sp. (in: a-proteobacteria)]